MVRIIYLFVLISSVIHLAKSKDDLQCANVVCASPLDCRYPNVVVELPDPYNNCCNITECVCEGSSSGLYPVRNPVAEYDLLSRYENCTMIDGNLEIVNIETKTQKEITLDAARHIRSVTGYVLIARTNIPYIDLSSLRLIRGLTLYREPVGPCQTQSTATTKGYGLYVSSNQKRYDESAGLREIYMPKLTEIMNGDVKVQKNRNLCFVDSIIWEDEILLDTKKQKAYISMNKQAKCPKCPSSCVHPGIDKKTHCWGDNTKLCQQFTRLPCKNVCPQRCNKNGACCDVFCAGGCSVENRKKGFEMKCHACKDLNNFGNCRRSCPSGSEFDFIRAMPTMDKSKTRYQFSVYCVPKCPNTRKTFEPDKICVQSCPFKYYTEDGYCKRCPGGGCSNICYGVDTNTGPIKNDHAIHSGNIRNFHKNCTIIEGSLRFTASSFRGDSFCNIPPISQNALEVFENVEEITGYLAIESWPLKDLCIFKNLEKVRGHNRFMETYSLMVLTDERILRSLCFNSLQKIEFGDVLIYNNYKLCHSLTIDWRQMLPQHEHGQKAIIKHNSDEKFCAPCSELCDSRGCWGTDSTQCVSCKYFTDYTNAMGQFTSKWVVDQSSNRTVPGHNTTKCVKQCDTSKGVYATLDQKCHQCDKECKVTCDGPGPANCSIQSWSNVSHGCKNVNYKGTCVAKCPVTNYADDFNECQPCSSGCIGGGQKNQSLNMMLQAIMKAFSYIFGV